MSSLRVGKSFPQLLTRDEVFTSIKKLSRCMHLKRLNLFISILKYQKSFHFFICRGIGRGKKRTDGHLCARLPKIQLNLTKHETIERSSACAYFLLVVDAVTGVVPFIPDFLVQRLFKVSEVFPDFNTQTIDTVLLLPGPCVQLLIQLPAFLLYFRNLRLDFKMSCVALLPEFSRQGVHDLPELLKFGLYLLLHLRILFPYRVDPVPEIPELLFSPLNGGVFFFGR